MRRTVAALILLSCAGLAGCARADRPPGGGGGGDAFADRARAVAAAWRLTVGPSGGAWRRGFVPLDELTVPPDQGFTGETKLAFGSGWYRTRLALPGTTPAPATIAFPDGSTMAVPLVSAASAYGHLYQGDPPCPAGSGPAPQPAGSGPAGSVAGPVEQSCAHLTVTGVTLGSTPLRTSRGTATVPAWLFRVAELPGPIARVAVAGGAVSPVPQPSTPPLGPPLREALASAQRLTRAAENMINYTVGVGACEDEPTALVYETAGAVVLAGARTGVRGGVCPDLLKLAPVAAHLDRPLGDRVVLDAVSGAPLVRSWGGTG
jgi:hypothetical protein